MQRDSIRAACLSRGGRAHGPGLRVQRGEGTGLRASSCCFVLDVESCVGVGREKSACYQIVVKGLLGTETVHRTTC